MFKEQSGISNPAQKELLLRQFRNMAAVDKNYALSQVGTGNYQCYCEFLKSTSSEFYDQVSDESNACYDYSRLKWKSFFIGNLISFLITAVNFVIRFINIKLIRCIQYHTVSQEVRKITVSIFVATFANTAFLLLLGSASME